jgi:hypothetical protein
VWGGGGVAVSYAQAFNIIGFMMNLGGVILLFIFGLPFCVRTSVILEQPELKAVGAEVFSWLGMALIVLGAAAQIKAIVF